MQSIESWAQSFIGRTINVPKSSRSGVVVRVEPSARGNGAWLRLDNGDRVYRQFPKSLAR
jgi:hypothetical protein